MGESIDSYHVALDIGRDGWVNVEEVITYQFGDHPRHGIIRHIPIRERYDSSRDRLWVISDVTVHASPATPAELNVKEEGNNEVIRIGDPKRTVIGVHTYSIDYRVFGALDRDQLWWNAIGNEWPMPVAHPSVGVTAPVPITDASCSASPFKSIAPCGPSRGVGSTKVDMVGSDLLANQSLTVLVSLAAGSERATTPILADRPSSHGLHRTVWVWLAAAGLVVGISLLLRTFRPASSRDSGWATWGGFFGGGGGGVSGGGGGGAGGGGGGGSW